MNTETTKTIETKDYFLRLRVIEETTVFGDTENDVNDYETSAEELCPIETLDFSDTIRALEGYARVGKRTWHTIDETRNFRTGDTTMTTIIFDGDVPEGMLDRLERQQKEKKFSPVLWIDAWVCDFCDPEEVAPEDMTWTWNNWGRCDKVELEAIYTADEALTWFKENYLTGNRDAYRVDDDGHNFVLVKIENNEPIAAIAYGEAGVDV
jgi:hypothetical protein